jgi:hypothetical protein
MPDATRIEFLRFGSSIPGAYWGCCAADVIQCFTGDPDDKASIEMIEGDGAAPCTFYKDGSYHKAFAGPTNRDIFLTRLRVGTFGTYDMPNHAFFAILTKWQIESTNGKKWLKILKECGFEFVRSVSNSVYTGTDLEGYSHLNKGQDVQYIFMLVRNIGAGNIGDPYTPPKEWTALPPVVPEAYRYLFADPDADQFVCALPGGGIKALSAASHKAQTEIWNKIGPAKFLTEAEVEAAGAPVVYAAKRTNVPQEEKSKRWARNNREEKATIAEQISPFAN